MTMSGRPHAARRVLVVSHEASMTGAPKVAVEVLRAFRDSGAETTLVNRWGGPLEAELSGQAGHTRSEPCSRVRVVLRRFRRTRRMAISLEGWAARRVLRAARPDLVWANTALSACYVPVALELGIPVVLHLHELGPLLVDSLARYPIDWADDRLTVVACSEPVAAAVAAHCPVDQTGIHVVLSRPNLAGLPAERQAGLLPAGLNVVACGTADHRKGADILVEAARILGRNSPDLDVTFTWVGSVKSLPPVDRSEAVRFVGERTDPLSWISAADIVVVPSRQDPFPLVTLEAMALGKAVVGTRVGGIPDQLGDAGLLVEPEDPAGLALAVERLCTDPALRERLGAAARHRAETLFDAALMRDQILCVAASIP